MEKLDLLKLSKIDKDRIKKVIITKYATEEFAVAANLCAFLHEFF